MDSNLTPQDLYNQDGVLLFAKGNELTPKVRSKLEDLQTTDELSPIPERQKKQKERTISSIAELTQSVLVQKEMEACNDILNSVLFADQSQPWKPYLAILENDESSLYSHSVNVSLLCLFLAIELGLKENDLVEICVGGLLHDIGKVLIPKPIRQKAQQNLTAFESDLLRQHCQMGYDMIQSGHFSEICSSMILQHHERLDGSGYPNALKADSISPSAQICMVADMLDRATSFHSNFSKRKPSYSNDNLSEIKNALNSMKNQRAKYPYELLVLLENKLSIH